MSGNWVMGSLNKASTPSSTIMSDITRESTGLLINVSTMYIHVKKASIAAVVNVAIAAAFVIIFIIFLEVGW